MNPSDQNPKLPTWIFITTDVVLLATAAWIAQHSAQPLPIASTIAIVACVGLGAIALLVPLVARFERQKNETLDDRQRALEALARTVSTSAEQISIATGGLHEIAELAQKNLRHAEQLPHKLQEKIAEFQAQLATANDADKEEMERELLSLRTSESERLESVSQRIAKSATEWAKLESGSHQHLVAAQQQLSAVQQQLALANEAVANLAQSTAGAISKAQAAAEQALGQARIDAARAIGEESGAAARAVEAAKSTALTELDTKLAAATTAVIDRVALEFGTKLTQATQALDEKIAQLEALAKRIETPVPAVIPAPIVSTPVADESPVPPVSTPPVTDESPAPVKSDDAAAADPIPAPSPKRPRKPRREEPAVTAPVIEAPAVAAGVEEVAPPPAVAANEVTPAAAEAPTEIPPSETVVPAEPAPTPVENIPDIAPVAPQTAEAIAETPVAVESAPEPASIPEPVSTPEPAPAPEVAVVPEPSPAAEPTPAPEPETPPEPTPVAEPERVAAIAPAVEPTPAPLPVDMVASDPEPVVEPARPARKRTTVRKMEDDEPGLGLDLDDTTSSPATGASERVITSDGATRLIATAYIGIGNRLFIRGEGPGLSWEKGVPLQFVSIGKWRWESNDVTAPVQFKLYKNDDLECTAVGMQLLEPGHQHELTAAF